LKVLGEMLSELADLLEANADEFSALEVLDVGTEMLRPYMLFVFLLLCRQGLHHDWGG
jgi:hypothetical protein